MKRDCDRCGKETAWPVSNEVHITLVYPDIQQEWNLLNLCEDCQRELLEWIEKGVKNGREI